MRVFVCAVLYDAQPRVIGRLVDSVGVAAQHLRTSGAAASVGLLLGDCGSPLLGDDPLSGLAALPMDVTYADLGGNLGHSGGCNALAASQLEANDDDVFVFLNPDALPEERALTHLVRVLSRPEVGVVDARQLPFEHPKAFDESTYEQSWASGACLGIRAGVFREAAGFDAEHFWSYCNDVDLSWRVRLTGRLAMHVPEAVVFHDKRLDARGRMLATPTQDYFSTLGRLNLASRYGRPDLVGRTGRWVERHGSASHRRALAEFRMRAERGQVPKPLVGAASVAEFVGGEYAPHRF